MTGVGGANSGGGGAGGMTTTGTAGATGGNSGGVGGTVPIGGTTGVYSCTPGVEQLIITDRGYPYASTNPLDQHRVQRERCAARDPAGGLVA